MDICSLLSLGISQSFSMCMLQVPSRLETFLLSSSVSKEEARASRAINSIAEKYLLNTGRHWMILTPHHQALSVPLAWPPLLTSFLWSSKTQCNCEEIADFSVCCCLLQCLNREWTKPAEMPLAIFSNCTALQP